MVFYLSYDGSKGYLAYHPFAVLPFCIALGFCVFILSNLKIQLNVISLGLTIKQLSSILIYQEISKQAKSDSEKIMQADLDEELSKFELNSFTISQKIDNICKFLCKKRQKPLFYLETM